MAEPPSYSCPVPYVDNLDGDWRDIQAIDERPPAEHERLCQIDVRYLRECRRLFRDKGCHLSYSFSKNKLTSRSTISRVLSLVFRSGFVAKCGRHNDHVVNLD